MLKVYGRVNSINVQKVMWAVAETGVAHQRFDAGMAFGVVGEPWYGELNPNRLVPTIDDDGVVLWESNAIVRYLAAKHAPGVLIPTDPANRGRCEMWMEWQQTTLNPGLSPVFVGLVRTAPEKRDNRAIRDGEAMLLPPLAMLDRHLTRRDYVLGERFTVADIPVGASVHRWYALPIAHPEFANLRAWYDRLSQRPAFQQHVMLPLT